MLSALLALSLAAEPVTRCAPGPATEALNEGRAIQREKGEGGVEDAIERYQAALHLDPHCASALWELGWSNQAKGDWDAVLVAWDHLRTLDPTYPELDAQYPLAAKRRDQSLQLRQLPEPGPASPRDTKPSAGPPIHLAAVGDVNMGRAWPAGHEALPDEPEHLFDGVRDALRKPDVTLGNLETVLADSGESTKCGPRSTKCFAFRVPTAYAKVLQDVGFDVMSIANNHAGDFGPTGRKSTIAALDAVGIKHSGPIGDLATWQVGGRKFAMVGLAFGSDMYRIQDIDVDRKLVALLKKSNDIVIVFFHAGAEGAGADHVKPGVEHFLGENRGDSVAFAHAMIDAGADLALGSGPHLWRAMELYQGRLIAYSMGNFSTWETFGLGGANGITGILNVTLAPNGVATAIDLVPAVIEKPGKPKPDPEGKVIARVRTLSKDDFGHELLDEHGHWSR